MLFFVVQLLQYFEFKVEHTSTNQSFSWPLLDHHHPQPANYVLSCANIISLMQLLKKGINTEGMSIHFLIKSFLETTPPPHPNNHINNKNQALKVLLVTAVVNLVLYLDLWVRKCFNFIFFVISNTTFVAARHMQSHTKYLW